MEYSVLIAVYKNDNPEFLKASLISMINQTKAPKDIVLVKDGFITDDLQSVIDNLNKMYGNLITEVQLKTNVGLGLALNAGIPLCKEELIARMDADDIAEITRCDKQLTEFLLNPALDIVGSSVKEFSSSIDNITGWRRVPLSNEDIYQFAKTRDPFNHPTVMYKKSKVNAVGGYSDLRKNQDTDLWIKMLSIGCICKNIEESLVFFRFDDKTYEKRKSWINTKLLIKIRLNAYKTGFCSISDFIQVALAQIFIFVSPVVLQRFVYKNLLRR